MTQFSLELAQQLSNSVEQFPVALDDAWQWIGYSRKDKALDTIKSYFEEGVDFTFPLEVESDNHEGFSPQEKAVAARRQYISLTVDCFKQLGMLARTEKGKQIRLYFLDCEKIAKQSDLSQLTNLIQNMNQELIQQREQMLRLNVDHEKMQQLQAEKEQLVQEQENMQIASNIHPGCAEILVDQLENEENNTLMTGRDFVYNYGIAPSMERAIVLLANGYQKCGKSSKKSPKQQGTNRVMIELRYLKRAARLVLGLDE